MSTTTKISLKGLRITAPRQKILDLFSLQQHPISYEDYSALDPTLDKSTFYRNIQTFESIGIIRSIESDEGKRYFEIASDSHPHFICRSCHNIICLSETTLPELHGYRVESVIYKVECPQCSAS